MRTIVLLLLFFSYGSNPTVGVTKDHSEFWSFITPHKGSLPKIKNTKWAKGDIDQYILSKIEKNGLSPAQEAAPEILVKRLFYDLIGLPPTFDEVKRYMNIHVKPFSKKLNIMSK